MIPVARSAALATLAAVAVAGMATGAAVDERWARVGPGTWRPLYPPTPAEQEVPVGPVLLARTPVTNGEYLAFVQAHPSWRRDRVAPVLADGGYLSHWDEADVLGVGAGADQPVTRVSWFAAAAYCEAQGARLPTVAEWELAAAASETAVDAAADPEQRARILGWYARPTPRRLPDVGQDPPNAWGVHDLHGLVWEWVLDFNSQLVSGDNREDGGADRQRFCGAGALSAQDKDDYAAFMRTAFRSSLEARYTTGNLGFRCAREVEPQEAP